MDLVGSISTAAPGTNNVDYCRACMASEQTDQMIFLFKNNINITFTECTSLEINETDNLPPYLCNNCHQQLDDFSKFRRTCRTSDSTFKQKVKIEKTDEAEEFYDNLAQPILAFEQYIDAKDQSLISPTTTQDNCAETIKTELKCSDYSDNEHSDRNALFSDSSSDVDRPKTKKYKKKNSYYQQKSLTCDICDKKFLAKHILVGHLRHHVGLTPFSCPTCEKPFNHYNSLLHHERIQHKSAKLLRYNCGFDGCDKAYKFKSAIKRHFKLDHVTEKPSANVRLKKFSCELCNKRTYEKSQMEGHMRAVHEGKAKAFLCNICGKEYFSYRNLVAHTQIKHSTNFVKYKCDYAGCDKEFSFVKSLISHKNYVHLGVVKPKPPPILERHFVCEQCGKAFKRAQDLKHHYPSHTGEKPFGCHICPKRYVLKGNLNDHVKRHLNIRTHECPICGAKKTSTTELKIHINYHTNEHTYPCTMCPSVFKQKGARERHTRIVHLGYKPYKCTICHRDFSKNQSLKNHLLIHSGEKPYPCPICDRRFRKSDALKGHLKTHNKVKA